MNTGADGLESQATGILLAGQVIRPSLTLDEAKELVERLYGLQVLEIREFVSYDDRNFHVKIKDIGLNPNLQNISENGYILKVTNSLDSAVPGFIDGQNRALLHVSEKGIPVPVPVPNIQGNLLSLETLNFKEGKHGTIQSDDYINQCYAVRLLTFLPGRPATCKEFPYTKSLLFQWGNTLAQIHDAFQDFRCEPLESRQTIWSMLSVPRLRDFYFAVPEAKRIIVENIVDKFTRDVIPNLPTLPYGIIHGDLNEQNILVRPASSKKLSEEQNHSELEICGLLDFGDIHRAPYAFDLAISILYCILECKTMDPSMLAGGYLLAGYLSSRSISSLEFSLLPIMASARLCQSLVMGAYSHMQDPSNTYLLTTAQNGWTLLEQLDSISSEELCDLWKTAIKNMNCSSDILNQSMDRLN